MQPVSVWEKESFFAPRDLVIIGSGFTGLWSAYYFKKRFPTKSVAILERGLIPSGASSRNAGFACFGSFTELISDKVSQGEDGMLELVEKRYKGLERIRKVFTNDVIGYENLGGYELLSPEKYKDLDELRTQLDILNHSLRQITGKPKTFQLNNSKIKNFGFGGSHHLIENKLEGQLHSGKLLESLIRLVSAAGVQIFTNVDVLSLATQSDGIELQTTLPVNIWGEQVLICTNAFAKTLIPALDIEPARGQILLTEPIGNLKIKGSFHFDEGYYYFRNLDNRILLGGARNHFLEEEKTFSFDISDQVQSDLERFLREVILPDSSVSIEQRWSGIMAMGSEKKPIVQKINDRLFCAVRMSGMGVALAPQIGKMMSNML